MKLGYRIGAVLGGVLAGMLVIVGIEGISSLIYRLPAELDIKDTESLSIWVNSLPVGAFLFVLVAWACGCFFGAFVARRLAPQRSAIPGLIVWMLLTAATIANLIWTPHPTWVAIAGIAGCLIFGLAGLIAAAPRSYVVNCKRTIKAPIEKVFKTLATVDEFAKAVPGIESVEFLSDCRYGVGTRFRETRLLNGKKAATELEVTEFIENQNLRMVSDTGGAIWDTTFRVKPNGDVVEMDMQMDAIPHSFLARIVTPMILGMVSKFVGQDMDSIKDYCESATIRES